MDTVQGLVVDKLELSDRLNTFMICMQQNRSQSVFDKVPMFQEVHNALYTL